MSLTLNMWTSINMDAYPAVTCHFIDSKTSEFYFIRPSEIPAGTTAENLACVKTSLMEEWGIA